MKSLNCRVFCFTWFQSVNFNHLLKYEDSLAEIRTIEVDFFYFDLSRGGKVEKDTGADLGFIIVIDLPDYPFTVKKRVIIRLVWILKPSVMAILFLFSYSRQLFITKDQLQHP